jgi:hypothetical protein
MSISAASFLTVIAPITLGAIIGLAVTAIPIAADIAKRNWRNRFRQQIKLAIQHGNLTFQDLEHIAESWNQDRNSVLQSLRILLGEAVSTETADLAKNCEQVRGLLSKHQSQEPFAELPENISLQLARISESKPELNITVTQLASSLSELYSKNQRDLQKQKKYGLFGFIIGVIGVVLSIPGLYITFTT